MATDDRHRSGFDALRAHYEARALRCPACGFEDEAGGWETACTGGAVRYSHVCPSCGTEVVHHLVY
jgi:predicted RNA-binding Zn-ribbon protein involved in translation (DUF1610 family)